MDRYELVLGLPHTNHAGLAEHLLLMYAGHFQWMSIARAAGMPLSSLRTADGHAVYATFYFIEERFPDAAPITAFQLDDRLSFGVFLRAFKGMAVEGRIIFDHSGRVGEWLATGPKEFPGEIADRHPYIRFANIFITPEGGNNQLKIANPAGVTFADLPSLPNADNPYQLTRTALDTGQLGLLEGAWRRDDVREDFEITHAIDIDRDTNGAGLVYFANYVAFMDQAEREAMSGNSRRGFSRDQIAGRAVQRRRVAYYGNVSPDERIRTGIRVFQHEQDAGKIGFSYAMRREEDGRLICLSEAIKVLR